MRTQLRPVFAVLLLAISTLSFAASTVSPNITASWSGSAKGTFFDEGQLPDGSTTTNSGKASGQIKAAFTHTGNNLTISAQITPNAGSPFVLNIAGSAGDFSLWAEGSYVNGDGNTDQVFFAGHYTTKGDKIVGTMLIFRNTNITQVAVSLTKDNIASRILVPSQSPVSDRETTSTPDAPFNIVGSASGKSYTFGTSGKGAKYAATISGSATPASHVVSLTFSAGPQTFVGSEFDAGKAIVLILAESSEKFVGFGSTSGTGAKGAGWIYGPTRLVEVKFSVKKQ